MYENREKGRRKCPCFFVGLVLLLLQNSSSAKQQITLRVANWAGAEEMKLERQIAIEFMRLYPEVRVEVETIPTSYREKILTSIAAGSPPDVFLLDSVIIPAFLNRDILADLMPYIKKYGVDLSIYFPNVLRIAMRDSCLYALPKDFTPVVIYYNKHLFDEAGLPYPSRDWTWEDYLKLCRKLTRDYDNDGVTDQFGTIFSNYPPLWIPWVWMNGGDILSPDGQRALGYFNSPETKEALKFLIDLRNTHKVAPTAEYLTAVGGIAGLFYTGRIAMVGSGHWWMITLKKYMDTGELKIGAAPLPTPKGKKHVTVMYESGWCVPKSTPHLEWAVRLAIFLAGEEAARIRAQSRIAIPAVKSVAAEQAAQDPYGIERVFYEEVQYARQPWGTLVEEYSRIEDIAKDAVDEVMIGGRSIDEAFTEAAIKMERELARTADLEAKGEEIRGHSQVINFLLMAVAGVAFAFVLSVLSAGRRERRRLLEGYSFLAPSFLHLVVFVFVPLLFSLYLSFHRWNVILPEKPFVGLENFKTLLRDRLFWKAMKNTAIYTLHVPVGMAISLGVAVMLNQRIRGVNFFRTLYFLPSVSSFVAIAMVWIWLYQPQYGLINFILRKLGLGTLPWLSSPSTALISIMIMSIWMGIGYQMVIFLAGLQGIPEYLYEAALIDGASAWQRFRRITLPLLTPTTFFVLVTSVIGSFQVFTSVYVMTSGGPNRATDVVVYHIYQNAWEYLRMGYASAMSWILFVVILIATYVQFKLLGRRVEYG